MKQELIELNHISLSKMQELCGENDRNLKLLKQMFEIDFSIRGLELYILDDQNNLKEKLIDTIHQMISHLNQHAQLDERDVIYIAQCSLNNIEAPILDAHKQLIGKTFSNKAIFAKTSGQLRYIEALRNHELIISSGPAGTGKTFLSVVYAVQSLKRNEVQRIVLTRPVVEAGESLGFLPGDLKEKIDPYLRPLYDALHEMLGQEQVDKMIEKGIIEIAPLAYMRGRTFDDAFVILDEAQNTTKKQMLMFLTRMGFRTKMVITGDETQIDLKSASGLAHARRILKDVNGIKFVELSRLDIVRHPLVQKIIERYENEEKAT